MNRLFQVQETSLALYSYLILRHDLIIGYSKFFRITFFSFLFSAAIFKLSILYFRLQYLSTPSDTSQHLIQMLHIGYFISLALCECLSAIFLIRSFRMAHRASSDAAITNHFLQHMLSSTQIQVSLLAVIGTSRAIAYPFQNSAQAAISIAGQFDRLIYTFETLFPILL